MSQTNGRLDARSIEIRRAILRAVEAGRRGHIGSAFSLAEIVRVLYDDVLRFDPGRPAAPERDRFILSATHRTLKVITKQTIPKSYEAWAEWWQSQR